MPPGIKPTYWKGKKGRSGRKKLSVEVIEKAKERIYLDVFKKIIPEKLLAERHLELLDKREKVVVKHKNSKEGNSDVYEVLDQPDTNAVSKALDLAYKLRGDYAPERKIVLGLKIEDVLD